jgi:hypothetical protein
MEISMEKHPKRNAASPRKRLSYRQKVLSVYPHAHITCGGWSSKEIYCIQTPFRATLGWDVYIYLAEDIATREEAWKVAWKTIQKQMIATLES